MKLLAELINRPKSILTGNLDMERLFCFADFSTFMGCVSTPMSEDVIADMDWYIDPESGIIQLSRLIPLDVLYLNQHNDGTGKIWQSLYSEFADFVFKHYKGKNILEIGGAHDKIAKIFFEVGGLAAWTIIEPNPENINNDKVKVIKSWFDENSKFDFSIDTIVHSHVLEHAFNPREFMERISNILPIGGRHIFALPNMQPMLESKFTNCLNFEHTIFLTEYFVDYLLVKYGFKIIEKKYFGNPHSIFYATEKSTEKNEFVFANKYIEYKKIFLDFIDYHKTMVAELNKKIADTDKPVYLFGAHIFSQYLINFGLNVEKIVSILDNSPLKQGKRLYGTNLIVESPKVLSDKNGAIIILKAGIYNNEIKKDISDNINRDVIFT